MPFPVTDAERMSSAASLLLILLVIVAAGLVLLSVIGRPSASRLRHGKYILAWMVAGWIIRGFIGVSLLNNKQYRPAEADVACAGFGLIAGWLAGMIHGSIVVWWRLRRAAITASRVMSPNDPNQPS